MKVVTSGSRYVDIDAYAGCVALAELLLLQGEDAIAASSAILNESITASLRKLGKEYSNYTTGSNDEFVLIDISDFEFFDPIVKNGEVVEIIDHHPGYEDYWKDKLGNKAQIEVVGAACTQVVERWQKAGKLEQMDSATATLLAAGILDNTLNFTAGVTRNRDHNAYRELISIANLPKDFAAKYFSECQKAIELGLDSAIKNDVKEIAIVGLPPMLGQIVVWDGRQILKNDTATIKKVMGDFGSKWGLNLISISEAKSYFIATNHTSQQQFTDLFGVTFTNGVSNPYKMILRKEILRAALDAAKKSYFTC